MDAIRLFVIIAALGTAPVAALAAPIRCGDDGEGGACVWGRAEGVEAGAVLVRGLRIQLVGIAAPSARDLCFAKAEFPCAKPARKRMAELVSKGVACDILDLGGDSLYGRCRVAEGDLGRLMVQSGLAKAAKDGPYDADQASAVRERKGLWAADITLPKDWESVRKRQDKD
jgi:endonuclease YncB( thermonuclease family)